MSLARNANPHANSSYNVVDSSGWLEYFSDTAQAEQFLPALEDTNNLLVPIITIYEVFKLTRRLGDEDGARRVVETMRRGRVVDVNLKLALNAACNGLPLADSLIYATAREFSATLWTQDSHFEGLPGVKFFPKP